MTLYTQKSFTGGELSPALYARNDLAKYVIGLKTLKNGFVRAEGCVSNRSGLELVCEVKNSSSKVEPAGILLVFAFALNAAAETVDSVKQNIIKNIINFFIKYPPLYLEYSTC